MAAVSGRDIHADFADFADDACFTVAGLECQLQVVFPYPLGLGRCPQQRLCGAEFLYLPLRFHARRVCEPVTRSKPCDGERHERG